MATTLNFTKEGDIWVARYTSAGKAIVQLARENQGGLSVSMNLSGMQPVPVGQYGNGYTPDCIFSVNAPAGVEVTIKSQSEVSKAYLEIVE